MTAQWLCLTSVRFRACPLPRRIHRPLPLRLENMKAIGEKKTCSTCKQVLGLNDFHKNKAMPDGLHSQCKTCNNKARSLHKKRFPEKAKNWRIKNPHYTLKKNGVDVSADDFHKLIDEQNGLCAICGHKPLPKEKRLSIDHDHKTNKVRGLLCSNCNAGLGMFKDDIDFLNSAIRYLNK